MNRLEKSSHDLPIDGGGTYFISSSEGIVVERRGVSAFRLSDNNDGQLD